MKQPIRPVTMCGWYEHTDGTIGYYSWRGGGGTIYTALDLTVDTWDETRGPQPDVLLALRGDAKRVDDSETATWCELALEGHEIAIVEVIRRLQAARPVRQVAS